MSLSTIFQLYGGGGNRSTWRKPLTCRKSQVISYPRETFQVVFDEGLEMVSKEGMNWVTSLIPTNQIYLLILFYMYNFITTPMIMLIVPLLVFYLFVARIDF
jgi:hypothetical protein